MSRPRFFCDECVPAEFVAAMRQAEPSMDVVCVGEPDAPPSGSKDPALLQFAELVERILLSRDKRTMPGHLHAHFVAGHHTWGVVLMRNGFTLAEHLDAVLLIWGATEADEWIDRTTFIP